MHAPKTLATEALKELTVPPPAEVTNIDLTKEELLRELRALHIVLAATEKHLEASRLRDAQFEQFKRIYRIALADRAREEELRQDCERELAAVRSSRS